MAQVTRTTIWIPFQTLFAADLNNEFNNLLNAMAITASDVSASANIDFSQLNPATVAGVSATQTLFNKTLSAPVMIATVQTITAMSGQNVDGTKGNVFTRTLASSESFTTSGFQTGQCFIIKVQQGSGTSYTVTWFGTVTWITNGGTAPTQTTTSNGFTTYGFVCTGLNTFDGYLVGTN